MSTSPPTADARPGPALAAHSRFVQRVRRRYAGELARLPPGLPGLREIGALVQDLMQGAPTQAVDAAVSQPVPGPRPGRDLPSALRVARHLVMERLAVLDIEQAAPMDAITGAMTHLAEATLELALASAQAEADARHGPPLRLHKTIRVHSFPFSPFTCSGLLWNDEAERGRRGQRARDGSTAGTLCDGGPATGGPHTTASGLASRCFPA